MSTVPKEPTVTPTPGSPRLRLRSKQTEKAAPPASTPASTSNRRRRAKQPEVTPTNIEHLLSKPNEGIEYPRTIRDLKTSTHDARRIKDRFDVVDPSGNACMPITAKGQLQILGERFAPYLMAIYGTSGGGKTSTMKKYEDDENKWISNMTVLGADSSIEDYTRNGGGPRGDGKTKKGDEKTKKGDNIPVLGRKLRTLRAHKPTGILVNKDDGKEQDIEWGRTYELVGGRDKDALMNYELVTAIRQDGAGGKVIVEFVDKKNGAEPRSVIPAKLRGPKEVEGTGPWTRYADVDHAAKMLKLDVGNVRECIAGKLKQIGGYEFKLDEPNSVLQFVDATNFDKAIGYLQDVNFNVIPAWVATLDQLSTGQKARLQLTRILRTLDNPGAGSPPVVFDEFGSTLDLVTREALAYTLAKAIYQRKTGRVLVAVNDKRMLHWLQPDVVFNVDTCEYQFSERYFMLKGKDLKQFFRAPNLKPSRGLYIGKIAIRVSVHLVNRETIKRFWDRIKHNHYLSHRRPGEPSNFLLTAQCDELGDGKELVCGVLIVNCNAGHARHEKIALQRSAGRFVIEPALQGIKLGTTCLNMVAAVITSAKLEFSITTSHPYLRKYLRGKTAEWRAEAPKKGIEGTGARTRVGGERLPNRVRQKFIFKGDPCEPPLSAAKLPCTAPPSDILTKATFSYSRMLDLLSPTTFG